MSRYVLSHSELKKNLIYNKHWKKNILDEKFISGLHSLFIFFFFKHGHTDIYRQRDRHTHLYTGGNKHTHKHTHKYTKNTNTHTHTHVHTHAHTRKHTSLSFLFLAHPPLDIFNCRLESVKTNKTFP